MGQQAKQSEPIRDFGGLVTNVERHDARNGTSPDQVNLCCIRVGEIRVRAGWKEVTFEEDQ